MEPPFGLPIKWIEIVHAAKDGEDLYALTKDSDDRLSLFSAAIDDSNWAEGIGKPFVQKMLQEWSKLETAPKGAAELIRANIRHLGPLLPETLELDVGGKSEKVFPLLFQEGGGEWFQSLYRSYAITENKPIPLQGALGVYFPFFKEFFYEGKMESLWKEPPEKIVELQRLAEKYRLKELSEYVFRTFKNYLNEDALAEMLRRAVQERSWLLAEELCLLLNRKITGAAVSLEESGLKLVLEERFSEEVLYFKNLVRILEVKRADSVLKDLLVGVRGLKLSGPIFPEQLREYPPKELIELDLSDTVWGWDLIRDWAPSLSLLRGLKMAKTPPIPDDLWPALEHLKALVEIDLTYQPEPTPVFLDLLHATFPKLERIIM